MNRSQLKQLINEIVQRKLNEATGKQAADSINKIFDDEGYLEDVRISTFYGSEPLKIMEIWSDGRTLYINVDAPSANNISEADMQTGEVDATQSTEPDQQTTKSDPTLSTKQKELDKQKKNLETLSNVVKKSESNIAKREETIKKANLKDQLTKDKATKKQAPIISKINALQKDIAKKTGEEA